MAKKLRLLVIHCTATIDGREVTSDEIRAWHTSPPPIGRGWRQVGYSDLIHLDGEIENLVPYNSDDIVDPWEITNGVAGYNSECRHVVYVGGLSKNKAAADTRTQKQREALINYIRYMLEQHPTIKIAGHRDLDPGKACPSFNVARFLQVNGVAPKNIYKSTI